MKGLADTPFVVGSTAYNAHVQHIARSLFEAGALRAFVTGGADSQRTAVNRRLRNAIANIAPTADRELRRRAIAQVPAELVHAHWAWESVRMAAGRIFGSPGLEDWAWECSEHALDRAASRWIERRDVGGFLGVEHGALASLRAARAAGKPGIVTFLSPHHRTRARWVDREFAERPDLSPAGRSRIEQLAPLRDARRDEEAATAAWIETNSSFTTRSLVDAGLPAHKILTVPLGGPAPIEGDRLPARRGPVVHVMYAGPVSVRKGAHYLLRAWPRVAGAGGELHLYGQMLLADRLPDEARCAPGGDRIAVHGSVSGAVLAAAYLNASVLVLPTLCDGFGMVVSEALAHGLPVITTTNAGAADLIEHGVNGFIVPPADEDALAASLTWCLEHPQELFEMRRAALASAARWTWTDFRQRHVELLDRALSGEAQPQARFMPETTRIA